MEKPRNSEVQKYALSHTRSNGWRWNADPGSVAPSTHKSVLDFPTEFAADVLPAIFSVLFVVVGGDG